MMMACIIRPTTLLPCPHHLLHASRGRTLPQGHRHTHREDVQTHTPGPLGDGLQARVHAGSTRGYVLVIVRYLLEQLEKNNDHD